MLLLDRVGSIALSNAGDQIAYSVEITDSATYATHQDVYVAPSGNIGRARRMLAGEHGVSAEVIDLRSLRPLDEATLLASVTKTNRCVVAEEGWPHCGIGAQVVDVIQRDAFDSLDAPVLRVTQADVPMPYNRQLERAAKPSPDKIVAAARRVLYLD